MVPALSTADIATFAYWRQTGCTYVQLADVLPILHSYRQSGDYVDGTVKIFDTGSESAAPNNYVLVNVRIRADGWIMAWFPRTLMTGTADSGSGLVVTDTVMEITRNGGVAAGAVGANELAGYIFKPTSGPLSGNEYTIKSNTATTITLHTMYGDSATANMATLGAATYTITQSRGNLMWWGHTSSTYGDPTSQSTRLGRALHEMWEVLKANQQGGSGAVLSYGDVGYWDYEYTSATHLYIFGYSVSKHSGTVDKYYYGTVPNGVTLYSATMNHGLYARHDYHPYAHFPSNLYGYFVDVKRYSYTTGGGQANLSTNGFANVGITAECAANYGVQKTIRCYTYKYSFNANEISYHNQAIILLTSG